MGTASSCPRVEVDQARLGDLILSADPGKIATMPATLNCYRRVAIIIGLIQTLVFSDQLCRIKNLTLLVASVPTGQ